MKLLRKIPPITVLIVLSLVTIGLAIVGFILTPASSRPDLHEAVVLISRLLKLDSIQIKNMNVPLHLARFSGGLFALCAVWMVWNKIFREETARWRLRFWRRHVVICGLGRKGMRLAADYRETEQRVVVLSDAITDDEERECWAQGIVVVRGDATNAETLAIVRPEHAKTIVACCGSDQTNLDIAMQSMLRFREGDSEEPLSCHAHVASLPLRDTLQRALVLRADGLFDLRFFHSHEIIARQLLSEHPLECDSPDQRPTDGRPVRLILIGSSPAAEAVLVQAALVAHYANKEHLRVTLVDRDPERSAAMIDRHPGLRHCCILTQATLPPQAMSARRWDFIPDDEDERRTVVIALEEDEKNVEIAFALAALPNRTLGRIIARVADRVGLLRLLDHAEDHLTGQRIHIFGAVESGCTRATIETAPQDALAHGIHHDYYENQISAGAKRGSSPAMVPWRDLPEDFRIANRANADHIDTKLRAIGCRRVPARSEGSAHESMSDDDIELLARIEHNRWCAERWIGGWDHAVQRDDRRKLHPSLKPWSELSDPERDKDRNTVRCLPSLLKSLGWKIVRMS